MGMAVGLDCLLPTNFGYTAPSFKFRIDCEYMPERGYDCLRARPQAMMSLELLGFPKGRCAGESKAADSLDDVTVHEAGSTRAPSRRYLSKNGPSGMVRAIQRTVGSKHLEPMILNRVQGETRVQLLSAAKPRGCY